MKPKVTGAAFRCLVLLAMSFGAMSFGAMSFGLSFSALAQYEVTDPNGVFRRIREFGPGVPFEEAFPCGELAPYQADNRECQAKCGRFCVTQCAQPEKDGDRFLFQLGVVRCTPDSVAIVSDDVNPLVVPITRETYDKGANSWIIPLLTRAGYFIQPEGVAEIERSHYRMAEVIENGKKRGIMAHMISGSFRYPGARMGLGFKIWYAPELKGPRQILYFGFEFDSLLEAQGFSHR